MNIDEFERYVENIDHFTAIEIKNFEFMSYNELKEYQTELEQSTGNLSDWDHLRAVLTLKQQLWEQNEIIYELENEVRLWKSNCGEYDEDDEMEEDDL